MDIILTVLLAIAAFILGAVPFSVIIGRWLLREDITRYGDGNPGAVNVFRAGGQKAGLLAVFLDVAKGVPFVLLTHTVLQLAGFSIIVVAVSAILGHAFSPFLRWRGGKAIAVTFGVLLALPQHDILLAFMACTVLGALLIDVDAWTMIFGASGTLAYVAVNRGSSWELLLMIFILGILAIKHFESLHTVPHLRGRLLRWVQSITR
jgi:acyl phosphate:glycerol-3-phosphate acyltransferase